MAAPDEAIRQESAQEVKASKQASAVVVTARGLIERGAGGHLVSEVPTVLENPSIAFSHSDHDWVQVLVAHPLRTMQRLKVTGPHLGERFVTMFGFHHPSCPMSPGPTGLERPNRSGQVCAITLTVSLSTVM